MDDTYQVRHRRYERISCTVYLASCLFRASRTKYDDELVSSHHAHLEEHALRLRTSHNRYRRSSFLYQSERDEYSRGTIVGLPQSHLILLTLIIIHHNIIAFLRDKGYKPFIINYVLSQTYQNQKLLSVVY